MEENEEEIEKIRKKISSRNPHAFQSKVKVDSDTPLKLAVDKSTSSPIRKAQHVKGCN